MLTTRFTFRPFGKIVRARGRCEMTLPFVNLRDHLRLTFPTLQWARRMARLAFDSFFPTTCGTRHLGFLGFLPFDVVVVVVVLVVVVAAVVVVPVDVVVLAVVVELVLVVLAVVLEVEVEQYWYCEGEVQYW
jgi:hypothetical protein